MSLLSIVIPSFREEWNVKEISSVIKSLMDKAGIYYEVIFVNDNSKDQTWDIICEEASKSRSIKGICFSRNYGKEAAIYAGLSEAKGDCCVVMDCDMQHPPGMIVPMYQMWKNGYEIIAGVKEERGREQKIRKIGAKIFHSLVSDSVGSDMENASDFMLIDRKVVDAILQSKRNNMFFRGTVFWLGFKRCEIHFKVQERFSGKSKWSLKTLCKYAVNNMVLFSNKPLQMISICGIVSFITSIVLYMRYMLSAGTDTDIIVGSIFLVGSMIMFGLGLIGLYLGKMHDESKWLPAYIIYEKTDNGKGSEEF